MAPTQKIKLQIKNLSKALDRLEEVLADEKDDVVRDATVKRFEFSFELSWKVLKSTLVYFGLECNSPRTCIRLAGQEKLITNTASWLEYQKVRNLTSHTYNEDTADDVYSQATPFSRDARKLVEKIEKVLQEKK